MLLPPLSSPGKLCLTATPAANRPPRHPAALKLLEGGAAQRFSLLLSDGQHSHPVVLAGEAGELAAGGGLGKGSVVHLRRYQASQVQGRT